MDPDYEVSESVMQQARQREQKDLAETANKVKTILEEEFRKELEQREAQLELIQNRIIQTSKALHLLRYTLVSTYYNQHETAFQPDEDENHFDKQNRIHPAVKKIIAENSEFTSSRTRKAARKCNTPENVVIQESPDQSLKRKSEEILPPVKIEVPEPVDENIVPVRNRYMIKKRVIVGNISKFMPSDNPGDSSTHKWMVYVRGPKESPGIDDYVDKVVFYLHPSYMPNDVIEVNAPPFHLSRRGWGEFPLRIQLYFKITTNKPVDIVHNLKLDRTYSGKQTLGNETIVELKLYGNTKLEPNSVKQEVFEYVHEVKLKEEPDEHEEEQDCDGQESAIFLEHNYAVNRRRKRTNSDEYPPEKRFKLETDIVFDPFHIEISSHRFRNVVQVLPHLLKKLPLVTDMANDAAYKSAHPYTASALAEYSAWPVEKRMSSEWSRAKKIYRILVSNKLGDVKNWNTKKIILFARANGYTELANYAIFNDKSYEEFVADSNYPSSNARFALGKERDVNIVDCDTDDSKKKTSRKPNGDMAVGTFVQQCVRDVGVVLQPEEVSPGVEFAAAERVIVEAVKSFVGNLLRSSRAVLVYKSNFSEENSVIGVDEINEVLNRHRPEFKRFAFLNKNN